MCLLQARQREVIINRTPVLVPSTWDTPHCPAGWGGQQRLGSAAPPPDPQHRPCARSLHARSPLAIPAGPISFPVSSSLRLQSSRHPSGSSSHVAAKPAAAAAVAAKVRRKEEGSREGPPPFPKAQAWIQGLALWAQSEPRPPGLAPLSLPAPPRGWSGAPAPATGPDPAPQPLLPAGSGLAPSCPNHSNSKEPNVFLCSWSRRTKSELPLVVRRSDGVSQGQTFRGQCRMMPNRTFFTCFLPLLASMYFLCCSLPLFPGGAVCWEGCWRKACLCCSAAKSCPTLPNSMD